MKKLFSLILIGAAASVFQSCSGDHTPTGGQDSVKDIPGYDAGAKVIDTSKVTTQLGSATMLENAGSGGTRIIKDTTKHSYYAGKPATAVPAPAATDTAKAGKDSTAKK